ncbi:hypothetical protein P154DRAFT_531589 [Amniculicola lignicola CBS 123094]|uniref:F-box domain-containing protein n=1 Tax=Amniculicola lignicola CBS 123094 TaxID=1392246 RepID=A0A6A5X1P0_9PLEO|nr:hypothetical protein P154DRAFT_531589 [Amniculicola lignicola CBS 123094]
MGPPDNAALQSHSLIILPSYITRHISLGYDDDDVAAFLSSIEASQRQVRQKEDDSLLHLPAEIVLMIVDLVPIDYILDFRLISRGVRDYIDSRVMNDYLCRTQVVVNVDTGYFPFHPKPDTYRGSRILRLFFSRLEQQDSSSQQDSDGNREVAVFHFYDDWLQEIQDSYQPGLNHKTTYYGVMHMGAPLKPATEMRSGKLHWCMQLDHGVMDLRFPHPADKYEVDVILTDDSAKYCIKIWNWKSMMIQFLRIERAIRRKMEQTKLNPCTFSHKEDSVRAIRRSQIQRNLDPQRRQDKRTIWALRLLTPLWGKRFCGEASPPYDILERTEEDSMRVLMLLRKEAAMTAAEHKNLQQLASDWKEMVSGMSTMSNLFKGWQGNFKISGMESMQINELLFSPKPIPENPIEWSNEFMAEVAEKVSRWKTQRNVIEQVKDLLVCSTVAMLTPEDAFDSTPSDI